MPEMNVLEEGYATQHKEFVLINAIGSLSSRITNRIKNIHKRWSDQGLLCWLSKSRDQFPLSIVCLRHYEFHFTLWHVMCLIKDYRLKLLMRGDEDEHVGEETCKDFDY
jgi:hypothetical protein